MADQVTGGDATKQDPVPKYEPGVLIGVEHYKKGKLEFSEEEQGAIKELCRELSNRDMSARREEIILDWKKRLYDRGFQHLLPQRNGGWQLPPVGSGYNPQDPDSRSMFIVNIHNSYGDIIESVPTRENVPVRFGPVDANNDIDITAANAADKLDDKIDRDNAMKAKMEEMARYLFTDGRAIFFSTYELDGQQCGYEPEDDVEGAVPEDEAQISAEEGMQDEASEENAEQDGDSGEEDSEALQGKPKGHEVIRVEGALEWKLPIKADCLAECPYAQRNKEIPLEIAKAKYPDVAEQLKPASGGPGGDDIDRLERINVRLGVMDNYNTTDMQIHDVTESKTFLRPAALLEIKKPELRDSIMQKCKKGLYVTFCGETYCEAYDATMDDQVVLVFAKSGDGAHRPGLGDWLVPVQEVFNNWLELANDYFIRGVPNKWMDNEMFNVEAMVNQVNIPNQVHPFDREPGVTMDQVIWEATPLAFPEQLTEFIQWFQGPLSQLLCGAVDALSGAGDSSATDTMGGMIVQRDQAIGRISLPWRRIKEAIAKVKQQAIQLLGRNHDGAITITGSEAVTIEMEHLKGNFFAYPEVDENIPVSYTQKTNQLQKLFADAATNPQIGELVYTPDNLELFKEALGLRDFYIPQIASRDKQLGEASLLLKGAPTPNPKIDALKTQLAQLAQTGLQVAQQGQVDPQITQQVQQIKQQLASLPPMVSSVPVRMFDDDATELAVGIKILNSPKGREMVNGTPEEQAGYANLELHCQEHQAAMAQKAAMAPPQMKKPPSVSINLKDLPATEAAEAANAAGIKANAADFKAQEIADAVEKHPAGGIVQ